MSRVVVDAMGGDAGLEAVIEGVCQLTTETNEIQMLLVGDADQITNALAAHDHDPRKLMVVHAGPAIGMDQDPRTALNENPNASILVAMELLARGDADALVSAGHTGATVLAASKHLEKLPGIRRAALASVYPTEQRHGPKDDPFALILDVGATLHASAEDLVNFAIMGSAYANIISDNPQPRVALLSNGTEANKGTEAIKEAHKVLSDHPTISFAGNVEGLDIQGPSTDDVEAGLLRLSRGSHPRPVWHHLLSVHPHIWLK